MDHDAITIRTYQPADKAAWDHIVAHARNGLFLFQRDYMEYHAHRFEDHSLIACMDGEPIALLPAHKRADRLYSHEGLTFGGWITGAALSAVHMDAIFAQLKMFLKERGITSLMYKSVPHIYHACPAEDDSYALVQQGAAVIRCDVAAVIDYRQPLPFSARRERGIRKARQAGITIQESGDYEVYYAMLSALLKDKYNSVPTHSLDELLLLRARFPANIRLFTASLSNVMLAGVVMYESAHVAHVQYIASSEEGRRHGALDALFAQLISDTYPTKRYFDFGTSHGGEHNRLNESLMHHKEEFGARAVAHYIWDMPI